MKNPSPMTHIFKSLILLAISIVVFAACKKKNEDPDLTVIRPDSVYLGTTKTTDTINVLANDTYFNLSDFLVFNSAILKPYSDSSVAIQTSPTFYGTKTATYQVTDKNGQKIGSVVVTRGNAAQIKTVSVLNSLNDNSILPLYAIDHDTNGVYQKGNSNHYIYKSIDILISFPKLSATIPAIFVSGFNSILGDGTVSGIDDEKFPVFYTIQDGFTAQAKTLDGKRTVTVTGYTINYQGHTLDFIYDLPAE